MFKSRNRQLAGILGFSVALFGIASPEAADGQTANPVPTLSDLVYPVSVAPGTHGATLQVRGAGFVQGSALYWNGALLPNSSCTPAFPSIPFPAACSAPVSAALLASPGTAQVTVVNPAPGGGTSNALPVQITNPDSNITVTGNVVTGSYEPIDIVVGDFDHDGRPDTATLISSYPYVQPALVRVQLASGLIYSVDLMQTSSHGYYPVQMVSADVNNDGYLDLVVIDAEAVYVLLNDRTGKVALKNPDKNYIRLGTQYTAQTAVDHSYSDNVTAVAVGDFNQDGHLDIAVTFDWGPDAFAVLLGSSTGKFTTTRFGTSKAGSQFTDSALAVGDFNLDGKLDLALSNADGIRILAGDGTGKFSTVLYNYPATSTSIVTGDFNGDGVLDLAYLLPADTGSPFVQVLLGSLNGSLQALTPTAVYSNQGNKLVVGDFDGDGKTDLAFGASPQAVELLLGNGDGTFNQVPETVGSWYAAESNAIAAADLNGDGRLDLVLGATQDAVDYSIIDILQSPAPQLSSASLNFGNQPINTRSNAQAFTITNAGSGVLDLVYMTNLGFFNLVGGSCFSFLNNALPGGAQCTFEVGFSPTSAISQTEQLHSLWSNAPDASVQLTGTGTSPLMSLAPATLTFPANQPVNSTSTPQTATLSNTGNGTLTLSGFAIGKDFMADTSACGQTLAPAATCPILVRFRPTVAGFISEALTATSNAPNSPLSIGLTGGGVAPTATLSTSSLTFASQGVETTSGSQTVTVTNHGIVSLTLTSIALAGTNASNFSFTTNCGALPASLEPGKSCKVGVKFSPAVVGTPGASLIFTDTALNSPQTVMLTGGGFANPVPFVSQAISPVTLTAGSTTPEILYVSGSGFLSNSVVKLNGRALVTHGFTANSIYAIVPPAMMASASGASVTVMNPAPAGGLSNPVTLEIRTPSSNVPLSRADLTVGVSPNAMAVGYFDADRIPDVAVLNVGSDQSSLTILLGDGKGGFTYASPVLLGGRGPTAIAAGDFNGDGNTDLAVANSESNDVTILLCDGKGGFAATASTVGTGQTPLSLTVGDFNRDGMLDLALVGNGHGRASSLTILLGDGAGGFASFGSPQAPGAFPSSVVTGDFNRDGQLDLAVVNTLDATVTIYLGDGAGNFAVTGSPLRTMDYPASMTVADFNGDGILDLAVANGGIVGRDPSQTVSILLGTGNGGFTEGTPVTVGTNPFWVVAGDFNGDGKMDLATANYGDSTVTIALGDGKGGFTATASAEPTDRQPSVLAAADFNRDGHLDLVTVNAGANDISVLLQQPGTAIAPIPADSIWSNGAGLATGQELVSQNGRYRAIMQTDGNFVIYESNNTPIWALNTYGQGFAPYNLLMQSDGNLVVYAYLNRCAANVPCAATWASNTNGKGVAPYILIMQDEGNLVIYDSTLTPTWASNTSR